MRPDIFREHQLVTNTLRRAESYPLTLPDFQAISSTMREQLAEAEVRLNLTPEALQSLRQKQFRSLKTGRGPSLVEAFGESRAIHLVEWCRQHGLHGIKNVPDSVGTGLLQCTADLLQSITIPDTQELMIQHINWRVYYGILKQFTDPQLIHQAELNYASITKIDETKRKKFATIPPGSLLQLWDFLIRTRISPRQNLV